MLTKSSCAKWGFGWVYKVDDGLITVTVVAVGKRDKNAVYVQAMARMEDEA